MNVNAGSSGAEQEAADLCRVRQLSTGSKGAARARIHQCAGESVCR